MFESTLVMSIVAADRDRDTISHKRRDTDIDTQTVDHSLEGSMQVETAIGPGAITKTSRRIGFFRRPAHHRNFKRHTSFRNRPAASAHAHDRRVKALAPPLSLSGSLGCVV